MIVLFILLYFVIGVSIAGFYNRAKDADMNEDQKRMKFLMITFWPIFIAIWLIGLVLWFIKYSIETAKWGINKLKKFWHDS